jgi:tetraacyldisaccharide 4'-kinase
MANVFRIIFFSPWACLWYTILWIRHALYNAGILKVFRPPVPVLSIGNLELGGSGKTPMTDYLIAHFGNQRKIACLSRGYRRKTSGFRLANENDSADTLGDEAYLLFKKWGTRIRVAVDANRTRGIQNLLQLPDPPDCILLDDAHQHRAVLPGFSLLLTPYNHPFFKNFLVPAGTLRDLAPRWKAAQALVFTKAPAADSTTWKRVANAFPEARAAGVPVFVSSVDYLPARNRNGVFAKPEDSFVCIAGLASNALFFEHCQSRYSVLRCIGKPDHYPFPEAFFSAEKLENTKLLCTEKDFHKLLLRTPDPDSVYFVPIQIQMYPEADFHHAILSFLA